MIGIALANHPSMWAAVQRFFWRRDILYTMMLRAKAIVQNVSVGTDIRVPLT